MRLFVKSFSILLGVIMVLAILLLFRYYLGRSQAGRINAELRETKITIAPVDVVEIVPIVESQAAGSNLRTEDGLSYLLKIGGQNILMDVGYNRRAEEISPLLHNMRELGLELTQIDAIAITHCHPDHVGGMDFRKKEVNLAASPVELNGIKVYTPIPMTCPTGSTIIIDKPTLITPQLASTGPLAGQIFAMGQLREQSLLFHLKGKGLVLVSGCGHPEIIQMVKAAQEMAGLPIYAVIGGAHMYYTQVESLFWRNLFGSSRLFARSMTKQEVIDTITELKNMGTSKVFISPHDADEATLQLFAEAFGTDFETVVAGKAITLGGSY